MVIFKILCAAAIIAICSSNCGCNYPCTCGNNGELGQWTVHFGEGRAMSDSRGFPCDFFQQCDAYLIVKSNGQEVWRGQTKWGQSNPRFDETLSLTLSKYTNIEIQMWDNDPGNGDDLMSEWSGSPESLSRRNQLYGHDWGNGNQNHVSIRTDWRPIHNSNNNNNPSYPPYNNNNNNPNYNNNPNLNPNLNTNLNPNQNNNNFG